MLSRLRTRFEVETEWPKTTAEARTSSAAAAAEGFDVVVAMGGDGVVHHVANGIGGTPAALGVIPAGSTNVLARLLGIPSRVTRAAGLICTLPTPRSMPAAMLTLGHGDGGVESCLATFSCGIGFDAAVVERAEQEPHRKYSLAGLHYARSAVSVAWTEYAGLEPGLMVRAGDRTAEAVAVFIRLYDKYTYFGRMPIRFGPHQPDTLAVLVARSLRRRQIPSIVRRALTTSGLEKAEGFEVWTGLSSLDVVAIDDGVAAQADGELLGSLRRFSAVVRPKYLRVLMPG